MTGVSKKSLQIWQRRDDSNGARSGSGVSNQSVESGRSNCSIGVREQFRCRNELSLSEEQVEVSLSRGEDGWSVKMADAKIRVAD